MGQYSQWLHYRDIDRHLHAQREKFIQEIMHLQEHVQRLASAHPDVSNGLIQALVEQRTAQSIQPVAASTPPAPIPHDAQANRVREEERHYVSDPQTPVPTVSPVYASLPPLPHPVQAQIQDEDISAATDPQISIPQWLLRAASTSQSGPLDAQGLQTNRLVQRWLERWGKQLPGQADQSGQKQNLSNDTNGTSSYPSSPASNSTHSITHEDTYL